jgi:predicted transcriptional regulator
VDEKEKHEIHAAVLTAVEVGLEAQLRAVRRLLHAEGEDPDKSLRRQSRSQVDIVEDILRKAGTPLHISEILARAQKNFGLSLDRESVVSALTKKVRKGDRFERSDRNVFTLKQGGR